MISARGGRDFLGTKLFQELGTNLKKKDQTQENRDKAPWSGGGGRKTAKTKRRNYKTVNLTQRPLF